MRVHRFRVSAGAGVSGSGGGLRVSPASLLAAVLLVAGSADASLILAPGAGVADGALNGATVAAPRTATAAAFANPASLSTLAPGVSSVGLGLTFGDMQFDADVPPGYSDGNSSTGMIPQFSTTWEPGDRLRLGIASYGAVGSSFKFDENPSVGINGDFKSEFAAINFTLFGSLELTDTLSIGAGLSGLFGQMRIRYTFVDDVKYRLQGPGVQGIVGLQWQPCEDLGFGLGYRTPGMIWMDGSTVLPDGSRSDMDLELEMPQQVFLGMNARVLPRVSVGVMGRWTGSSSFNDSIIDVHDTPVDDMGAFQDRPFIPHANDEWRVAAGVEFELTSWLAMQLGLSWADTIVSNRGVTPLVYDVEDIKTSAGLSVAWGDWKVDLMGGWALPRDRNISADEALVLPGHYEAEGVIVQLGIRTGG